MKIESSEVIARMTSTLGLNAQEIIILKIQIDVLTEENEKLKKENELLSGKE